jgi:hypothetical protein
MSSREELIALLTRMADPASQAAYGAEVVGELRNVLRAVEVGDNDALVESSHDALRLCVARLEDPSPKAVLSLWYRGTLALIPFVAGLASRPYRLLRGQRGQSDVTRARTALALASLT